MLRRRRKLSQTKLRMPPLRRRRRRLRVVTSPLPIRRRLQMKRLQIQTRKRGSD
jgi:hypothetical protein